MSRWDTSLLCESRLRESGATGGITVGMGGGGHMTPRVEPCPRVVSTAFMPDTAGCLCDVSSAPVSEHSVPVGRGGRKSPYSFHKEIFKIVFVLSIFF